MKESIVKIKMEIKDFDEKIKALEGTIRKIKVDRILLGKLLGKMLSKTEKIHILPTEYSPGLSWKEKILYVLEALNSLGVEEITTEIIRREKKLKHDQTYRTIQRTLLRLVNEGIVKKTGKYNSKYELKKK